MSIDFGWVGASGRKPTSVDPLSKPLLKYICCLYLQKYVPNPTVLPDIRHYLSRQSHHQLWHRFLRFQPPNWAPYLHSYPTAVYSKHIRQNDPF